jgi:hypothetical protein
VINMAPKAHELVQHACSVCSVVPWIMLPSEELEGYPHHKSLNALIASSETCLLCKFVLHAAVSNYRRSLELPKEQRRWRRFETVHTIDDAATGVLRKTAYVKELGQCMLSSESDVCESSCGYFTPMEMNWDTELNFGRAVITAVRPSKDATGVEPVEDAPIDFDELRKQVPDTNGVWVYGNYWSVGEPTGDRDLSHINLVGLGARFGTSGYIFDSINNPERHILIRGSALSVFSEEGKLSTY